MGFTQKEPITMGSSPVSTIDFRTYPVNFTASTHFKDEDFIKPTAVFGDNRHGDA
jgi:hypothetical protein